jgi:hypothetical protein
MAINKIKLCSLALGGAIALSLAAMTAGPAAAQQPGPYYDGYSAYGPVAPYAAPYAPSYYDNYGGAYYRGDDTVLVRPAFPPGCGAGEPHC